MLNGKFLTFAFSQGAIIELDDALHEWPPKFVRFDPAPVRGDLQVLLLSKRKCCALNNPQHCFSRSRVNTQIISCN